LRCSGLSLDACLQKLRYVKSGNEVRGDDLNTKVDCLKALSNWLRQLGVEDPLVDELDAIIQQIRYVKSGDIILPEDHNYVVDALKKARDIIAGMESYYISLIYQMQGLTPWGLLGVGYSTTDWLGNLYTPAISYVQTPPLVSHNMVDTPIIATSTYSEMTVEYIGAVRETIIEGVQA
jgi:hypothetical protein